jgi:hypothetical protein
MQQPPPVLLLHYCSFFVITRLLVVAVQMPCESSVRHLMWQYCHDGILCAILTVPQKLERSWVMDRACISNVFQFKYWTGLENVVCYTFVIVASFPCLLVLTVQLLLMKAVRGLSGS